MGWWETHPCGPNMGVSISGVRQWCLLWGRQQTTQHLQRSRSTSRFTFRSIKMPDVSSICKSLVGMEMPSWIPCITMKRMKNQQLLQGEYRFTSEVDILIEILSHLPISSLSRFRLVCKQWLTVITTDPLLSELHLQRGFKSSSRRVIINTFRSNQSLNTFKSNRSFLTMIDETAWWRKKKILSTKEGFPYFCSPSCNGLVCIYNNTETQLFNPTTLEKLVLLPMPTSGRHVRVLVCFLGYIPTTRKYKLVRFFVTDMGSPQCEVLTIGTYSWRQIGHVNNTPLERNMGVIISGVLYMNSVRSLKTNRQEIMSFDLTSENVETIPIIVPVSEMYSISEMEGKLCLSVFDENKTMDIWTMENKQNHAWMHICTVNFPHNPIQARPELILIDKGIFLMKLNQKIQYHDLKTGKMIKEVYDSNDTLYQAQIHIESLVSLATLIGQEGYSDEESESDPVQIWR